MPEFLELLAPKEALSKILTQWKPTLVEEDVETSASLGRITARPVISPHPLPGFDRSSVDGYAVRARDTFGAGDSLPAYLRNIGEVLMGVEADFAIAPGECSLIHTGGMMPQNADAVVMVEHTQRAGTGEIEVMRAVAPGENVIFAGEDVGAGQEVISKGTRLRPAEIGGLIALGITSLPVIRRPRVGIVSSGDEIVSPNAQLTPGKVRDVNSHTLAALVEQYGGIPIRQGIAPDRFEELQALASKALKESDLVVITAGSSASERDLTAQVIGELGEPGVLVHGVNVKPGKPTILGLCSGKPVIGLPGNPVSALVIAELFLIPMLDLLQGVVRKNPRASIPARLAVNLSSQAGREDWIPVSLVSTSSGFQATPIFGKSNLIFTLARADGLICIPPSANGLNAGEKVEVIFL